ncbi:replication restart DNA helicase PriA [Kushneria sinocarnis]|uniref:Replication restart protein PriA n=1 Tax=Kushneria sinocarnis TaxID=595502 RepID=A0A420WXE3_9GAMM|nr:primosomal protein N' [Kushneria sinocarnis]RKR04406.1 replication restart DNA helicase PriA [Kushneria sinocarnis]
MPPDQAPDSPTADPAIVVVAVPTPLRRCFDYLPGNEQPAGGWCCGVRVRVTLGRRQVVGIVVDFRAHSDVERHRLKPIEALLDQTPLPADWLWLCRFTARYYQHSLGDTLANAMPVLLRQGRPLEARTRTRWFATEQGLATTAEQLGRARRQAELLGVLSQHRHGLVASAITAQGFDQAQLRGLHDKGLIDSTREWLAAPERRSGPVLAEPSLTLNHEQSAALAAMHEGLDRFHPVLLHGVTGSGKTEVYLQLIEAVLDRGRQALILVPEIALTPQTLERFRRRFSVAVVALHSGLNDNERLDAWEAARAGRARIIIGTRSAIFTPLAAPGVIIIDEEHDSSFKQHEGLRYHARDLAVVRAQHHAIPIVMGSATPALETLRHAHQGVYRHLRLTQRAGHARPADMRLVDLRGRPLRGGLGPQAMKAIGEQLDAGRQVLIFINRRGFAPSLSCHECGWIGECRHCDARLTLHRQPHQLICHHCDTRLPVPDACPSCGSADLRPQGAGTERTEETLSEAFPDTPVLRVDRDTTRRRDALEQTLTRVRRGEPCLLVGTQMLAKGHHFPHVTLVVVVNADGGLYSADFRAMEHSAALLTQVAGRAGRASHPGQVLIQTHHPDDPGLRLLIEQGFDALAEQLLEERRMARLPPWRHMVLIRAEGQDASMLHSVLEEGGNALRVWLGEQGLAVDCLGPVPAPMERRQTRWHVQLMLSAERRSALHRATAWLDEWLAAHPGSRRLRYSVDVDPQEMT